MQPRQKKHVPSCLHSINKSFEQDGKPASSFHVALGIHAHGLQVAAGKVLCEEVHQLHIVLEVLQLLAGVVAESRGVCDDGVDTIQTQQEIRVLSEEAVVLCGATAGEGRLVELEGCLEVLDGGYGDLVGGVHRHALTEAGQDALQLLVSVHRLWEGGVERLPRLRHAHHLEGGREEKNNGIYMDRTIPFNSTWYLYTVTCMY